MARYYATRKAKDNGAHEVHRVGCRFLPATSKRIFLGEYSNCQLAMSMARQHFKQVNGCPYCSPDCHAS